MTEHKYAQVLRWIADGKEVQTKFLDGSWVDVKCFADKKLASMLRNEFHASDEFRLAPRTVKVGDVEIEPPLSECQEGEKVFVRLVDGEVAALDFYKASSYCVGMLEAGRLFRTPEAAEAAHAAWVKLMRGDA